MPPGIIAPHRRYLFLTVSLLVFMVLGTFLKSEVARILVDAVFMLIVLSGVIAIQRHKRVSVLSLVLGIAVFVLFVWNHISPVPGSLLLQKIVEALFMTLLIISILGDVVRTKIVTLDTVSGASCVYLMMGLMWGSLYSIIEHISPGSFSGITESDGMSPLIYFSFVTLTTLGYGDISPASPPAALFAMLEAIIGQLFLVILVARLVALQISHSQRED